MTSTLTSPAGIGLASLTGLQTSAPKSVRSQAQAWAKAVDFEATFLNTMMEPMMTATDGEGPFSGSGATGMWRSLLTQEYAKSFAKAGGIGLAAPVYHSLLAHQAANLK